MHRFAQIRDTILLTLCVAALFLAAEIFYFQTPSTCYLPSAPQNIAQATVDQGTLPRAVANE